VTKEEIIRALDLESQLREDSPRPLQVFRTSVVEGIGYTDAFKWLSTII